MQVRNLNTGEIAYETQSDAVNGQFLVCLKANSSYVFNGYSTGYMIYSVQLKLDSNFKSNENYDIYLEPITNGLSTVLKNVFFDIDAAYLSKASYSELDNLIKFLKLNPTVSLRIEGHTDNTGNEIYNKNLSIDRAKAVYDYLIKCQIPAQRLEYKGYGSTKPVAENNTDFNRQLNRRTQIVILAH